MLLWLISSGLLCVTEILSNSFIQFSWPLDALMLPVLHSSSLSFLLQSACQQAEAAPPEDMVQRVESVGVCLQKGLSPDLEQPPSLCLFWGYQNPCSTVVSLKSVIPRVHTLRLQQERMTNLQPGPLVFSAFKHTQRGRNFIHRLGGEKEIPEPSLVYLLL